MNAKDVLTRPTLARSYSSLVGGTLARKNVSYRWPSDLARTLHLPPLRGVGVVLSLGALQEARLITCEQRVRRSGSEILITVLDTRERRVLQRLHEQDGQKLTCQVGLEHEVLGEDGRRIVERLALGGVARIHHQPQQGKGVRYFDVDLIA